MKNFIWDFDGNLYDTYPMMMKSFVKAMKDFDIDLSKKDIHDDYIYSKLHSFKELFIELGNKYNVDALKLSDTYHMYEHELQKKPNYFENADIVLKSIKKQGGQNFLLTHRDTVAIEFLKSDDLAQYFTDFVTSENNFARKPNPESINYLIDKYNLSKEDSVMIGDRDLDLLAGINAGIKTIYFDIDNLKDNDHATYTVKSLNDILELVNINK